MFCLPLSLRDRYNRYSKKTYQAVNTAYPLSTSALCGCSGLANLKGVRSFCIPIYEQIFDNNARPYQRFATVARCARRRRTADETGISRETPRAFPQTFIRHAESTSRIGKDHLSSLFSRPYAAELQRGDHQTRLLALLPRRASSYRSRYGYRRCLCRQLFVGNQRREHPNC